MKHVHTVLWLLAATCGAVSAGGLLCGRLGVAVVAVAASVTASIGHALAPKPIDSYTRHVRSVLGRNQGDAL